MRLSKTFWLHNDFEDLAQSLQSGATGGKRGKYVLSAGDEKKITLCLLFWANEVLSLEAEVWKEARLGWAQGWKGRSGMSGEGYRSDSAGSMPPTQLWHMKEDFIQLEHIACSLSADHAD